MKRPPAPSAADREIPLRSLDGCTGRTYFEAFPLHGNANEELSVALTNERIRIRMEGYDHEVLDRTASEILATAKETGADVHGPIPLPTRIERYTVLRSPHIDRKSREQFEIRTHKRLIDILRPTQRTIEALNKGLSLPPGVDIKIRVIAAG
ncbi:MAG: 30S ribosomal protein S10 [Planctomycetes bacterium]|nr:30S ribosomal protein S10 [Planctomycetota bacterium]